MIAVTIETKIHGPTAAGHPVVERSRDVLDEDALSFLIEGWFNDLFERTPWYVECFRALPTAPGATHAYVLGVQSGGSAEQERSDTAMIVTLLGSCIAMLDLPFATVTRMSFVHRQWRAENFAPNHGERIDDWLIEGRGPNDHAACQADFTLNASRGHLGDPKVLEELRRTVAKRLAPFAHGSVLPARATGTNHVVSVGLARPTAITVALLSFAILESLDRLIGCSTPTPDFEPLVVADLVHL